MRCMRFFLLCSVLVPFLFLSSVAGQELRETEEESLFLNRVMHNRPFLMSPWREYQNYAFQNYKNYDNFLHPYTTARRNYYGPLGTFLINGYEVYLLTERRGSIIEGDSYASDPEERFNNVFSSVMVGSDAYNNWSARLTFAGPMGVKFTPLTLDLNDHRGIRLDVLTPNNAITGWFNRIGGDYTLTTEWMDEVGRGRDRKGVMMVAGHGERKVGLLHLGATYVDAFVYDSWRTDNGLKGVLRPGQVMPSLYAIRFTDESPRDGRGGPVVYDVNIHVNGELRDDLAPFVIKANKNNLTAVGKVNRVSGRFMRSGYTTFTSYQWNDDLYYDKDIPLFADNLYFRDYVEGGDPEEIGKDVNLEQLMSLLEHMPNDRPISASGDDYLLYYFDLSEEEYVESVEFDALVGNDYQIEVSEIDQVKKSGTYESKYNASFFRTFVRSSGNVQNLSNLERVRFQVGVPTALALKSLDLHTNILGLKVNGELAQSVEYDKYPDGKPGILASKAVNSVREFRGKRFERKDWAYYLNVQKDHARWGFGGEYFSIGPLYQTQLKLHVPGSSAAGEIEWYIRNRTGLIDLVQDNDDDDRWTDMSIRQHPGNYANGQDIDGVFPGKDEDNDGIPDTNRNNNYLPDYVEPFLLYDVEPDDYVYGLDLNNNDVPDEREDDLKPDYPYPVDLRGFHVFGRVNLTKDFSVMLGRIDAHGIMGGGNNKMSYGRMQLEHEEVGFGRVRAEANIKRVKDDIPDLVVRYDEKLSGTSERDPTMRPGWSQGYWLQYGLSRVEDELRYRNSLVGRFHFETHFTKVKGLNLVNKTKFEINQQKEGRLDNGMFQEGDRIDLIALVNRANYTWKIGRKVEIIPQLKQMFLKRKRRNALLPDDHQWALVPILKMNYWLTSKTVVRAAGEGLPKLPYRVSDLATERESFDRWTYTVYLTNWSGYFGYQIATIVGLVFDKRDYEDPHREIEDLSTTSVFFRVIVGY